MTHRLRALAVSLMAWLLVPSITTQAQTLAKPTIVVGSPHSRTINAMAFSSDERWIASAGSDSVIKLWDVASGRFLRILQGHANAVKAVAISSDSRRLVSIGEDGTARIGILKPAS